MQDGKSKFILWAYIVLCLMHFRNHLLDARPNWTRIKLPALGRYLNQFQPTAEEQTTQILVF